MTYLRNVVFRLRPKGVFVADLYGGERQFVPGGDWDGGDAHQDRAVQWEQRRRPDDSAGGERDSLRVARRHMEDARSSTTGAVGRGGTARADRGGVHRERVYADYAEAVDGEGGF
ncbi:MAG: hypothetical protein R3B46_00200 [Phycisphaerales bacterium]